MSEIRYPYKPNLLTFILVTFFFGGCAFVLTKVALSNSQGVVFNRLLELSAKNATIFYWCLVVASIIFVLTGLVGMYSALTSKKEIILTEDALSIPSRLLGNKTIVISYGDITHIAPINVKGQNMLKIQHEDGDITIQQSVLPSKQAYNNVVETITTKTQLFQD